MRGHLRRQLTSGRARDEEPDLLGVEDAARESFPALDRLDFVEEHPATLRTSRRIPPVEHIEGAIEGAAVRGAQPVVLEVQIQDPRTRYASLEQGLDRTEQAVGLPAASHPDQRIGLAVDLREADLAANELGERTVLLLGDELLDEALVRRFGLIHESKYRMIWTYAQDHMGRTEQGGAGPRSGPSCWASSARAHRPHGSL